MSKLNIEITQERKDFEEALMSAIERYLQAKGTLTNGYGVEYEVGHPACSELYIPIGDEDSENKLEVFLDTTTNYHPCLYGCVTLNLRKKGDAVFRKDTYFFHIIGDRHVCGSGGYEASKTNEEYKVKVSEIEYFFKKGERLH